MGDAGVRRRFVARARLRVKYLGDNRPSSTVVCCQLLDPAWKLEVEATAAKG